MKKFIKKVLMFFPKFLIRLVYNLHYLFYRRKIIKRLKKENKPFSFKKSVKSKSKIHILFYHISGLNHGGTEKYLQIITKYLNKDKYEVYFMYAPISRFDNSLRTDGRFTYLKDVEGITFIPFTFSLMESFYPFYIKDMSPSIFKVISKNNIDLIITAGSGYPEFPLNIISTLPLLYINVFGSINIQRNVMKNICISKEVTSHISNIISPDKISIIPNQSERPYLSYKNDGKQLRHSLGIKDDDFVFGRIGRAENSIFDDIGIRAFQEITKKFSNAHYIIMSSPPILKEIVKKNNINNVHFLAPSSEERDIWSFHGALDALAHFRYDGESLGLNIIESMLVGNPIITHRSHIWNAHLEYLDKGFSRIADQHNVEQYASFMEEMINLKTTNKIKNLRKKAKVKAEKLFIIDNNIQKIESIIDKSIEKFR